MKIVIKAVNFYILSLDSNKYSCVVGLSITFSYFFIYKNHTVVIVKYFLHLIIAFKKITAT